MRAERIWPNGLRYLWTDAFGLVLLVSLYEASANFSISNLAMWLYAPAMLGRYRPAYRDEGVALIWTTGVGPRDRRDAVAHPAYAPTRS
jgi:hypothetical protein